MTARGFTILLVLLSLVKGCQCDNYTVTGLVVSSACAVTFFIAIVIVSIFFSVWANFLRRYYGKRGITKSPRVEYIRRRTRSAKATLSRQQDLELQIQAQQRLRPKLPNTWRAGDGQLNQPSPQKQQNGDLSMVNPTFTTTGDFIFGMEDGEGDGAVTDIYSVPVKVRNIDSVTDLPVDPERRTPRSSHQANPGEMVEIPLNEDEKSTHF